jgi:hypothetical protein
MATPARQVSGKFGVIRDFVIAQMPRVAGDYRSRGELPMSNGDMLLIVLTLLAFLVVLGTLVGASGHDATRRRTRTHR